LSWKRLYGMNAVVVLCGFCPSATINEERIRDDARSCSSSASADNNNINIPLLYLSFFKDRDLGS
jgi:hypothetical protein